jgi:nucleoside-diphosphate-sugar epimerase
MAGATLVTGGTGLIGAATIAALRERGGEIHALARSESSAAELRRAGAIPVLGDLSDPGSLGDLPRDLDAVVHVAAEPIIRHGTPPRKGAYDAVRASRIEGTGHLVKALATAPPRVLVSASAGAYPPGPERHGEEDALWSDNKYGAMIEPWEAAARSEAFPSACLRLPPVYGPSLTGGLGAVFLPGLLEGKGPKVIGNPDEPGSYVHVDDVVSAILACIDGVSEDATYNVCDDTPVTPMDFARAASEAFGAGKPSSLPAFLLKLVLGRDLLELFQAPPALDNSRLEADLGWTPEHPSPSEGWRAVARAMREQR